MSKEPNKKTNIIDEKFISLSQAAKRSGYTPEHLNLSARKGKLKAEKIGRNWYTTDEWLDAFLDLVMVRRNDSAQTPVEAIVETSQVDSEKVASEEVVVETNLEAEKIISQISEKPEAQKIFASEKKFSLSFVRAFSGLATAVIIIPVIFFSVYSVKFYAAQKNLREQKLAVVNSSPSEIILNENVDGNNFFEKTVEENILGIVRGEETTADLEAEKKSGVVLASENYKAQNVSMGVGIVLASAEENQPLEISDIKSESFITGKKNNSGSKEEAKLVVSWKTNKLAKTELEFSKNNGQDKKIYSEQSFGFNHAVVLTQIDPQTSYVYQIKAKDHWASESDSDFYGIFTASKPVSVFDLISQQINEIFGWAIKE